MPISGCLKAGEPLLGAREGVHLDSGEGISRVHIIPSSHHDPVLEFYGTTRAGIIWQIEASCCSVVGGREQLCSGAGAGASHEEYPSWTLPRHMAPPHLRKRVGLLPLSTEGEVAGPSSALAAARGEGGLCMRDPSW